MVFEYQTWLGFSLFGKDMAGEIGRGGSYVIAHDDDREELAMGFSLYIDPLVDAGFGIKDKDCIFLSFDTPSDVGKQLRSNGWRTVTALSEGDETPPGCTHIWDGKPVTLS